jgi:hypothetical protein
MSFPSFASLANLETSQPSPPEKRCGAALCLLCLVILVCAVAVRIPGALSDLTLDEIVSLNQVSGISSPAEIFTKLHLDNNHYLNSLWLYLAGPRGNWPGYRITSMLAGIGTVLMAWLICRRRSPANAWIAMLLTGFSYVLILYSDQARGYSCQVFFAFLSYHLLDIYLENRKPMIAVLFWFSAILGFLSHLDFVTFFGAVALWSAVRLFQLRLTPRRIVCALLLCFAVPALFLAGLYLVDIRYMTFLGGTPTATLFNGYSTSLAWVLPPLAQGIGTLVMFIAVAAGLLAGGWLLWREKSDSLIFFLGVILWFPCLLVIARGASLLYVRYFITGIAFALLLLSIPLASLWSHSARGRALCMALLLAYGIANGRCILILLRDGQGEYSDAVRIMMKQSTRPVITISGDLDFRINTVLQFYCGQLLVDRKEHYYSSGNWLPGGPEWMVYQKESDEPPVPKRTTIADGQRNLYVLVKIIPAAPLAAQHWFLYHNKADEPGAAQ